MNTSINYHPVHCLQYDHHSWHFAIKRTATLQGPSQKKIIFCPTKCTHYDCCYFFSVTIKIIFHCYSFSAVFHCYYFTVMIHCYCFSYVSLFLFQLCFTVVVSVMFHCYCFSYVSLLLFQLCFTVIVCYVSLLLFLCYYVSLFLH